jgi:hypothetical protein
MMSSGFRAFFVREGICYIKRVVFLSFAFLHPLLLSHIKPFIPLTHLSFIMASYAENILRMAYDTHGPSIRDMEVIMSFQSNPTTKDAVSIFRFMFLIVMILISFFRMGCPFIWIPELLRGLYFFLITTSDTIQLFQR